MHVFHTALKVFKIVDRIAPCTGGGGKGSPEKQQNNNNKNRISPP